MGPVSQAASVGRHERSTPPDDQRIAGLGPPPPGGPPLTGLPDADRRSTFAPGVVRALPVLLLQRLVINTGARMVFTYLPAIAAGSGLSIGAMSRVIFARDMTGLLGPLIGRFVRSRGAWLTMTVAGGLAAVGMALVLLGPIGVAVGLVLWGLCRTSYLVASASWIGEVVAYERRGRATGLVELTWAGAALVGLPLIGVLVGAFGWWAAPVSMAVLGGPLAVWSALTPSPAGSGPGTSAGGSGSPLAPATWVALIAVALLLGSAQFLFFGHGLWLSDAFGFDATEVAFAIVVVGLAEAAGSLGTVRITDLIGKRTAVLAGGVVLVAAQAAFVVAPQPPLAVGLVVLVVAFLGSEFGIVSSIALISELEPNNRPAVIGLGTGMSTALRATASLIAGTVYVAGGFRSMMAVALATGLVAVAMLAVGVREPGGTAADPAAVRRA